jgi:hypothetical protein
LFFPNSENRSFPTRAGAFRQRAIANDDTKRTMDDARMSLTATATETETENGQAEQSGFRRHGVCNSRVHVQLRTRRKIVKIFGRRGRD